MGREGTLDSFLDPPRTINFLGVVSYRTGLDWVATSYTIQFSPVCVKIYPYMRWSSNLSRHPLTPTPRKYIGVLRMSLTNTSLIYFVLRNACLRGESSVDIERRVSASPTSPALIPWQACLLPGFGTGRTLRGSVPRPGIMTWLIQLVDKLFCWIPRLWFVYPDEAGVRITLGSYVSDCSPGWYIEWPLIHTVIKVNTATQGVRFAIQSVTTKDDVDLAIRGAILYRITNARKAIFETADFDDALEAITGGVIEQFVSNKTYADLSDREVLKTEIKKGLRDSAAGWGIRLARVYIPDIGRVRNIRVLSDHAESLVPTDT